MYLDVCVKIPIRLAVPLLQLPLYFVSRLAPMLCWT